MADNCIFCKIVNGDIPCSKIYEDDLILSFLDIQPLSEGHSLVIPKQHFERLDQCSAPILTALAEGIAKVAPAVRKAMEAQGYNILNNTGRCAGQLVEHVHFHIIPRKTDDGLFRHWPAGSYPTSRVEQVNAQIRQCLSC